MIVNLFSSAVLYGSLANATKLAPVTPPMGNIPSVATGPTTPALHHDDMFLNQADAWADADVETGNECWRTRDMIKIRPYSDDSFYRLINRKDRIRYFERDEDFKHGSHVLYWADQGEGAGNLATKEKTAKKKGHSITWERAVDAFPEALLFGERGVTVDDVAQGSIGNCWLCSAFASLAESPGAVETIFLNTKREQSPVGMYGVNLFVLGHEMTIVVDDYLPIREVEGEKTTIFSKVASDGSLWVPILEKVLAKRYGNY